MKKIRNIIRNSNSFDLSGQIWARTVCYCYQQTKTWQSQRPPQLTKIPWSTHRQNTRIQSGGPDPLKVAVFVFNVPLTAKVIWRWGQGLKSHPTDWWCQGPLTEQSSDLFCLLLSLSSTYFTGEGSTGFFQSKLYFPRFRGVQHMYSRGRVKLFNKLGGVELLIDRTFDLY